jgi:hypothetical protein
MMELSEEAKAEIAKAVSILKSDGVHIHKTYPAFMKAQEEASKGKEPPEGGPPPAKDPPDDDWEEHAGLWGVKRVKKDKNAPPAQ